MHLIGSLVFRFWASPSVSGSDKKAPRAAIACCPIHSRRLFVHLVEVIWDGVGRKGTSTTIWAMVLFKMLLLLMGLLEQAMDHVSVLVAPSLLLLLWAETGCLLLCMHYWGLLGRRFIISFVAIVFIFGDPSYPLKVIVFGPARVVPGRLGLEPWWDLLLIWQSNYARGGRLLRRIKRALSIIIRWWILRFPATWLASIIVISCCLCLHFSVFWISVLIVFLLFLPRCNTLSLTHTHLVCQTCLLLHTKRSWLKPLFTTNVSYFIFSAIQ